MLTPPAAFSGHIPQIGLAYAFGLQKNESDISGLGFGGFSPISEYDNQTVPEMLLFHI